jgi:hypothetical protein
MHLPGAMSAQTCITVGTECNNSTDYCGPYVLSNGIYRIPFVDGADVTITNDHYNHCPRGRIDMVGDNSNSIVAAADGWIRWIEDDNSEQCDCSVDFCLNNYIWIEHPNGEWTKYTHMVQNSIPFNLDPGDWVTAGTYLGIEGDVGCASGVHLHFEVAQPIDTNTLIFDPDGGYIDSDWAMNVIPVICDITGNIYDDGDSYTAAPCSNGCSDNISNSIFSVFTGGIDVDIASTSVSTSNTIIFYEYAAGLYQAGNYVVLNEGFHVQANADFTARIGGCNDFPQRLEEMFPDSEAEGHVVQPAIRIFPDPVDVMASIEITNAAGQQAELSVFDLRGNLIQNKVLNGVNHGMMDEIIPTGHLPAGMYVCMFRSDSEIISAKFLVQH